MSRPPSRAPCGRRRAGAAAAQVLYFAEFDLQFFKTRSEMLRHLAKCRLQHPPGDEIYRNRTAKGSVSMYEVCSCTCTHYSFQLISVDR